MKPLKRIEHFLAKIAGDSSAKELTPKTRDEYYLNEIAENGGGSGGGGGNVLTLYAGMKDETTPWAYKNQERTEEYESYEEALDAVRSADVIKLDNSVPESDNIIFADSWSAAPIDGSVTVSASGQVTVVYYLYGISGTK